MVLPATKPTSLDEVRRELIASREDGGSLPWTLQFLAHADQQFGGSWVQIEIAGLDALDIVLPPHRGEPCRGDRMSLVPAGGATVGETAEQLRRTQAEYGGANPECWRRIVTASAEPLSSIVVSTQPLGADQYVSIEKRAGRLYHLDGFHRLVGWAWAGRLTPEVRIKMYVAGLPRSVIS